MTSKLCIYKVTDGRTGEILGVGAARDLVDLGLYDNEKTVSWAYFYCKKHPDRPHRRIVERVGWIDNPNLQRSKPAPGAPQPLDEDIQKLEQLNAERRETGQYPLSYGHWKAGLHR